jgi:hypothetical protein
VRKRKPALWRFVEEYFLQIVLLVITGVQAAMLIGLVNLVMPRFVTSFVNGVARFFLKPFVMVVRWRFGREAFMHYFTFSVCAQSRRNLAGQALSAETFGFIGGLLLIASALYSLYLHVPRTMGMQWLGFLVGVCFFGVLAPLSLIQRNQIFGFLAIAVGHALCTFLFTKLGLGARAGSGWRGSVCCAAFASMGVFFILAFVRLCSEEEHLEPLALGGVLLGHIAYFAAMLLLSSKWVVESDDYWNLQCIMGMSLSIVLLIGKMCDIAAFNNTSNVVLIIWLMCKELELKVDSVAMKLVAVYMLYHFLDQESIIAMFDPRGLYVGNPARNSSEPIVGAQ